MEQQNKRDTLDTRKMLHELWQSKRIFLISLPVAFVLACIYTFSLPREYTTTTTMAPESSNGSQASTLSSIASTMGFNMQDMNGEDAISPLLYPDLMDDNGFVARMFKFRVRSSDNKVDTTYLAYLQKFQKHAWWQSFFGGIHHALSKKEPPAPKKKGFDPYDLTKDQDGIVQAIRAHIEFAVDKKTGVISVTVSDQDPLICKTLADSVRNQLQTYITEYRTSKSRRDVAYYRKLAAQAKKTYEHARQVYGQYSDANTDVILESYKSKTEDLENDMQIKFNAYSQLQNQLNAAEAKLQERIPVFTIVQGAAVPVKPDKPKRMRFVAMVLFLVFLADTAYILRNDILG